jgi:hypothetical protein
MECRQQSLPSRGYLVRLDQPAGLYQIGEVQARSCIFIGTSAAIDLLGYLAANLETV